MTNKNLGGRPKKEIDKELFEDLCKILCTKDEICNILNVDEKTLTKWCKKIYREGFSDIYKKLTDDGKSSLRRAQYKAALSGNATMLVWMGKQFLGQTDKVIAENPESGYEKLAEELKQSKKEE